MQRIRRQPSLPLLRVLARRLRTAALSPSPTNARCYTRMHVRCTPLRLCACSRACLCVGASVGACVQIALARAGDASRSDSCARTLSAQCRTSDGGMAVWHAQCADWRLGPARAGSSTCMDHVHMDVCLLACRRERAHAWIPGPLHTCMESTSSPHTKQLADAHTYWVFPLVVKVRQSSGLPTQSQFFTEPKHSQSTDLCRASRTHMHMRVRARESGSTDARTCGRGM